MGNKSVDYPFDYWTNEEIVAYIKEHEARATKAKQVLAERKAFERFINDPETARISNIPDDQLTPKQRRNRKKAQKELGDMTLSSWFTVIKNM